MNSEKPPLCICGSPRIKAKQYIQETGSEYYKTCGNLECRGKKRVPYTVGNKQVRPLSLKGRNDPNRMCKQEGCFKPVGETNSYYQKQFCSRECQVKSAKRDVNYSQRKWNIRTEQKRQFLSEVYKDITAGATKLDIRRKYRLNEETLDQILYQARTNRQREIRTQLWKEKNA